MTIGSGVTGIGEIAFCDCAALQNVTIPSGVTSIGVSAFAGCAGLTSVTIPDSVTSVGGNAFQNCKALTSVTLSSSITSISNQLFDGCENLASVMIPSGVTSIGSHAFNGCKALTSIMIPAGVTDIGVSAFGACLNLASATIPDNVTSISANTFSGCRALASVTIGGGVTSIGARAFQYCVSLTDVYFNGTITAWSTMEIGSANGALQSATIHYLVPDPLHTHSFTAAVTAPATCVTDGVMTYTCACGESYTEAIPASGQHTYDSVVTAPTCTTGGYTTYTCKVCGDTYTADETPKGDHTFTDWHVTIQPTTEHVGMEIRNCTVCRLVERRILPQLPTGYGFFSGGVGTEANPLQIATETDFDNIDDFFTAYGDNLPTSPVYFKQMNSISLRSLGSSAGSDSPYVQTYPALQSCTSTPASVMHDAVYDGCGKEIVLGVGVLDSEYAGLFGLVTNSTIRNLRVWMHGSTILSTSANGCAGLIARAENCTLDTIRLCMWENGSIASWTGSVNVGALAGCVVNCTVQNCLTQTYRGGVCFIGGTAADFTSRNTWWTMEADSANGYDAQYVRNVTGVVLVHDGATNLLEINGQQIVIPGDCVLADAQGVPQPEPLAFDPTAVGLRYDLYLADRVTFAAGEHGSLTGAGSAVLFGEIEETKTVAGLMPIPDTGYVFSGWSITAQGDAYPQVVHRAVTLQPDGTYTFSTYIHQGFGSAFVTANFEPHDPHTFGEWSVTTPPTADAAGEETRTCTVCGAEETRVLIPAMLTVHAPGAKIYTGDTVTVTVDLTQNPGLIGMLIGLIYNADVLTLTDVQAAGMFTAGDFEPVENPAAQTYAVAWIDALTQENHTETGSILIFTFTVKETAHPGDISFTLTYDPDSTFNLEEDNVPLVVDGATVTVVRHQPGDSDGDGELDLCDVMVLMRYIAGGWENVSVDARNADVNADGKVNLKDAVLLRRYLAGWDVVLQ